MDVTSFAALPVDQKPHRVGGRPEIFFGLTTFLLIPDPSVCLRHGAEHEAVHAVVINQLQKHFLASSQAPEISVVDLCRPPAPPPGR